MPLTRKSVELPVRATRSHGSALPTTPVNRGRGTTQRTISTKTTPKTETKDGEMVKPRATKAESVVKNPKEESIQAKRTAGRKTDKSSTIQDRESVEVKQEPASPRKAKKRPAGDAYVPEIKKHKSSSETSNMPQKDSPVSATMFSPRRSSRAVVPNSRFKDMEMLEPVRKKSAVDSPGLDKKKNKEAGAERKTERNEERKTNYITSVQAKSKPGEVTEEVITEETPIDTQAQMNLFDEVLILPTASVAPPTSHLQQILPPAMHNQETLSAQTTITSAEEPDTTLVSQTLEPDASLASQTQEPDITHASQTLEPDTSLASQTLEPDATLASQTLEPEDTIASQTLEPDISLASQTLEPDGTLSSQTLEPDGTLSSQTLEPDGTLSSQTLEPDGTLSSQTLEPDGTLSSQTLQPDGTLSSQTLEPDGTLPSQTLEPDGTLPSQTLVIETGESVKPEPVLDTDDTSHSSTVPVVSSVSTMAVSDVEEEEEIFIPSEPLLQPKPSFSRPLYSPAKDPSPHVIVVRSVSERLDNAGFIDQQGHASLMPKYDSMKRKLAESVLMSKQKTLSKPNVIVLGKDESRKKPRKIIVTPTHTARNEANKKAKAEAERSGAKVVKMADKPTSFLSSVLTGKAKPGISHELGQIVLGLDAYNASKATVQYIKDSSVPAKVGASSAVDPEAPAGASGSTADDATFTAVPVSKVTPQVVYVTAKHQGSKKDAASNSAYDIVTSPSKIDEVGVDKKTTQKSVESLHDATEEDALGTVGVVQEDILPMESDVNRSAGEITVGNDNIEADGGADLEDMSVTQTTRVMTSSGEEVILEDNNEVEELAELEEDKKSADDTNTYCQVIPVDQQKRDIQTAIEYVVFGEKMVPIHKPISQVHGRITSAKQQSGKRHGRVEIIGQGGNSAGLAVRKIPVNAAQTAISSVLAQMGEDRQPVVLNSVEIGEPADEASATEEAPEPQTRVIHGYIDRQSDTVEPTQIVEISQDLFAKEVYGETVLLDQVSGEVMPESMVGVAVSQPMETETMATTTSTNSTLQPLNSDIVTQTDTQTEEVSEPNEEEASLPLVAGQTDTEAVYTDGHSENVAQAVKVVNQSEESLNQSGEDEEDPTEVTSSAVSTVTQSVPDSENTTTGGLDSVSDPKVTTKYNKDGSMTIYIDGSRPEKNKMKFSTVTVPNIIRVDSSKPGVYKPSMRDKNTLKYRTIPVNQSNPVGVKKLVDLKINTAMTTVKQETKPSKPMPSLEPAPSSTQRPVPSVSMAISTQTQTEMETQTESMEEEDGEEEEGREDMVIVNDDINDNDQVRRSTRMTIGEDGQVQEYVVVSLPEGKEIKNYRVPPVTRDPVHDEVVTMSEDGMYVCLDCDHKTEKKSNWYKHRRKHLGIRPHACSRCSYKAATSSNLKRHMQIHDDVRNFFCNICNIYFRQKIHLERHIKYKHQEKKVKCPLCDYLCSSENPDLKIHIRRRHMPHEGGNMAAFTCEECGLMTVSKKDLKQHMKFHKKGPELKLFCEFCSFVTDCESRLRRHMLIHTKEKPFQCGLCSYRASQKEHVLRHMRSQHDVEVERRPRRSLLEEASRIHPERRRRSLLEGMVHSPFPVKDLSDDSGDGDKPFEKSDYSSTDKIFACNHCSMKFSKLINLYKHLYVQHKQVMPDPTASDFQCVVCEFRTNNKKNLLVHMRKHNMQDHTPPSHVYSCVLCRYMNPRRRNLFQHMKKKHGIEIVMKEDGSNCYVTSDNTSVVLGNQPGEANVMALSEIVTTETIDDDSQLQIVTEDGSTFQGEKISIDNIISVEDMAAYVSASQDQPSPQATMVNTSLYQTVAEHEAAEAIEGLQALAQQPGVLETQTIDNDITAEIVTSEILAGEEVMSKGEQLVEQIEDPGIQLSTEQINQLSTGDFVEINGEVYKVEIAQEGTLKVE